MPRHPLAHSPPPTPISVADENVTRRHRLRAGDVRRAHPAAATALPVVGLDPAGARTPVRNRRTDLRARHEGRAAPQSRSVTGHRPVHAAGGRVADALGGRARRAGARARRARRRPRGPRRGGDPRQRRSRGPRRLRGRAPGPGGPRARRSAHRRHPVRQGCEPGADIDLGVFARKPPARAVTYVRRIDDATVQRGYRSHLPGWIGLVRGAIGLAGLGARLRAHLLRRRGIRGARRHRPARQPRSTSQRSRAASSPSSSCRCSRCRSRRSPSREACTRPTSRASASTFASRRRIACAPRSRRRPPTSSRRADETTATRRTRRAPGVVNVYERLLPYAVLFGMEREWVRVIRQRSRAPRAVAVPLFDAVTSRSLSDASSSIGRLAATPGLAPGLVEQLLVELELVVFRRIVGRRILGRRRRRGRLRRTMRLWSLHPSTLDRLRSSRAGARRCSRRRCSRAARAATPGTRSSSASARVRTRSTRSGTSSGRCVRRRRCAATGSTARASSERMPPSPAIPVTDGPARLRAGHLRAKVTLRDAAWLARLPRCRAGRSELRRRARRHRGVGAAVAATLGSWPSCTSASER